MARLKFDLKPLPVPFCSTPEQLAEHESWVREVFARHHPEETPRPCDCGYFEPTQIVSCHEDHRRRFCHRDPLKRLEQAYRERHLKALREKRVFPGPPFAGARDHICWWCGDPLPLTKKGKPVQRVFHNGRNGEPDCAHQEDLHTQMPLQRDFLLGRDGLGCRVCGIVAGGWVHRATGNPAAWRSYGPSFARSYPPSIWVGECCATWWITELEVDHIIALGLVAHLPDEERRRYFGPENLQLLCVDCHKIKTRADTRAIRALQAELRAGLPEQAPPGL